jgi:hypothetical protein
LITAWSRVLLEAEINVRAVRLLFFFAQESSVDEVLNRSHGLFAILLQTNSEEISYKHHIDTFSAGIINCLP